jgi:hypothetical protein
MPDLTQHVRPSLARSGTVEDLREHLQWAIELEDSTLPPYLVALYSLDPERRPEAVEVVASASRAARSSPCRR